MADAIVFTLPEGPETGQLATDWWLIAGDEVVESGTGDEWVALATPHESRDRKRIALAPAGLVRIDYAARPPGASERQAASVARVSAIETSMSAAETLHAASALVGDRLITAVVARDLMMSWIDWARTAGADPHHIVPISCLLPAGEEWTAASFGSQQVIGRSDIVMVNEPALARQFVGDAEPRELRGADVERTIVAAAERVPIDLRTGRMARRRTVAIDRRRIRELALLVALIPLIGLLITLISIAKLEAATERLNDESLAIAERALGRPVTLETVESELAARAGGAAFGGATALLTGLYSALQMEQGVTSTDLSYRADGTLTVSLAAPNVDPINRALVALQRDGYRITAVPRQASDGRSIVEVTVRSEL